MSGRAQSRIRLLVLMSFTPRLDAPHAGRAMASFLSRLADRHDVALVCFRADGDAPVDDVLIERCVVVEEVASPPTPSRFRQRATRLAKLFTSRPDRVARTRSAAFVDRVRAVAEAFRPQVIQFEFVEMAQYAEVLGDVNAARVLVDHDPGFSAATDYSESASGLRRLSRRLDAIAWKRFSRRVLSQVDRVVVFTDRDRDSVASLSGNSRVVAIPFAVELPESPLDPGGALPPTVLFFGDYLHAPNADAALRLLRTIMPAVRRSHPDAVLELIGAHPTSAMTSSASTADLIPGTVPSLTPHLERAAVVAVPLRLGGGMRVKVLESLGAGKALVASQRALEGLAVEDGRHVLIAEEDAEFADAIAGLLADDGRRASLATAARRWAECELGFERTVAAYAALYGELLADRE